MTRDEYNKPPEEIDMSGEERAIRRDSLVSFIITATAFTTAYLFIPSFVELPTEPQHRLAFAALCWAIPGLALIVAILMVSAARRTSADDIGGQAAGPPSEKIAVKSAFLQNTLEQAVAAGTFYFALAALAGGAWMALLPAAVILFLIGRVLFYAGYRRGARGRAFGMALTMLPTVVGYLILIYLLLFGS
jgi:uncharacterized membrane protein YecN with MAPEG domain